MSKTKKQAELEQQIQELTLDLQRTRADFENYRKRVEEEKLAKFQSGQELMITKLLPIVDNVERAVNHLPKELKSNSWAEGVVSLQKGLNKILEEIGITKITATPNTPFDPNLHNAISVDEADGELEVIAEELQAGYSFNNLPIRHSLVRVTRIDKPTADSK